MPWRVWNVSEQPQDNCAHNEWYKLGVVKATIRGLKCCGDQSVKWSVSGHTHSEEPPIPPFFPVPPTPRAFPASWRLQVLANGNWRQSSSLCLCLQTFFFFFFFCQWAQAATIFLHWFVRTATPGFRSHPKWRLCRTCR